MMRKRLPALILLVIIFVLFYIDYGATQEVVPEKQTPKTQVGKSPEKITPSPRNIKEKTGVYVFLAWMWLSIIVLIYVLRQKIREVDRLFLLKFFLNDKRNENL